MNELDFLTNLTHQAGKLALSYYGRVSPAEKPDKTFVTEADKAVEDFLRKNLEKSFPDIAVLGEETDSTVDASLVWVIDPIDGTANFVAGLPIWGISVGLLKDGIPTMGAIYFPVFNELYSAEKVKGSFLNGNRINVKKDAQIHRDDLVGLDNVSLNRTKFKLPCKIRNLGTAVGCFTFVAKGALIGGLVMANHIWDVAAGICIATEAGAKVIHLLTCEPIYPLPLSRQELPPTLTSPPQFIDLLRSSIHLR